MERPFNWGIIGLGKIARKFAEDIALVPNARVFAVASRDLEKARAFAKDFSSPFFYGAYQAVTTCPELDAVYIATPHNLHAENALFCLEAKIPVLVEKPFTLHRSETELLIREARINKSFIMEALWSRYLPAFRKMLQLVESGAIGEVRSIRANFGFEATYDPDSRLFDPKLGGGALLDIGIYPVYLAYALLGVPDGITLLNRDQAPTGVDQEMELLFKYNSGATAELDFTFKRAMKTDATIVGTKGEIYLPTRFYQPRTLELRSANGSVETFDYTFEGHGYHFEAQKMMEFLQEERLESPWHSLSDSLSMMQLLERIEQL